MDTASPQPAIKIEDVLSEFHCSMLSDNAKTVYLAVWYRMKNKGRVQAWFDDAEISWRARVILKHIPAAKSELINIGLLECWQGHSQWSYDFVELDDPRVVAEGTDYYIQD
jgi:hypothetical protein